MKKLCIMLLAAVMSAAVISTVGCAQPASTAPAASDSSVVSETTAKPDSSDSAESVIDGTDSQPVANEVSPAIDCSALHNIVTDGKTSRCSVCGSSGTLPVELPSGYITQDNIVIEAGGIQLTVDKGVYVPGGVEEKTEKLINALESVSGLSFSDAKYNYNTVNLHVAKIGSEGDDNGFSESEAAGAWAVSGDSRELEISAGDLFLGNSYAIAHELSHTLNFSNSSKFFCTVASEGFAEYNCCKAIDFLEQTDPQTAFAIDESYLCYVNMEIGDPSVVYSQSIEYWMENDFPSEYSGNGSYSLGFRFMAYLDDVYGDYSKWITISDDMEGDDQNFPIEQQLAAFRKAYGNDVFDGFYPWLKKNEECFDIDYNNSAVYDLRDAEAVTIYPFFMSFDCPTTITSDLADIQYSNLYVNLEEAKKYLALYKNRSLDDLVLDIQISDGSVELFDPFGKSLGVVSTEDTIPLDGVSFLLIKGEGMLDQLSVTGYRGYTNSEDLY